MIFKMVHSSLIISNLRFIDEENLNSIEDNLFTIYNALIDFLIECLSTGNDDVLKILDEKFSEELVNYCVSEDGLLGVFIEQKNFSVDNIYEKDILIKLRIFDFMNTFFSTIRVSYIKKETKMKDETEVKDLAFDYFRLFEKYAKYFYEKYVHEKLKNLNEEKNTRDEEKTKQAQKSFNETFSKF